MYIKQLTVHGFKSYRDETVFGPFSPHHNVIVGRNGSGKSNFFAAIRFVLHDAYTKLGQEERQALLHEGGGNSQLSAYVEVVFDNAEGRFPTGRETTTIRRTVGLKKDEYSLDGKSATKTDVLNLLQAAGFSKSNPYYIVPQGRVTALTNARDEERLALLKEVAGTRTYEEHRQESLKILHETSTKREKIAELLTFIQERLTELDEEREELAAYQEVEKERRCIEYILQHRESIQVGESLERLENENAEMLEDNATSVSAFDEQLQQVTTFEGRLEEMQKELKEAEEELRLYEEEVNQLRKDETRLILIVEDHQSSSSRNREEEASLRIKLDKVNADIEDKESQLAAMMPRLREATAQKDTLQNQLNTKEARREALFAKQGRSVQFRSAAERDRWIKKELDSMEASAEMKKGQIASLEEEIASAQLREADLQAQIQAQSAMSADVDCLENEVYDLRQRREQLVDQRKELWRAENKLESSMGILKEEVSSCENRLLCAMDKSTLQGLEAVKRIFSQMKLNGVYGALYELFDCDTVYRVAAETIAGGSLFHVVVDSDATASRLLEVMVREKAGRVTFMPLNRLRPTTIHPPQSSEAVLLLSQLRYDARFEPAMRQVFGKALVCPDLASGAAMARASGLTAITLNGDCADKKGALSGGFVDSRGSKLDLASKWRASSSKLAEHQRLLAEVKAKLLEAERQINRLVGEIEQKSCKLEELRRDRNADDATMTRELTSLRELVSVKIKAKASQELQLAEIAAQMTSMQAEIGTPLTAKLAADEQHELSVIISDLELLRTNLSSVSAQVNEIAMAMDSVETELEIKLRKRRHELTLALSRLTSQGSIREGVLLESELKNVKESLQEHMHSLEETRRHVASLQTSITSTEAALDKARTRYEEGIRQASSKHQSMEKYLSKRAALIERRELLNRRIRELAYAPDQTFASLRDQPEGLLMKQLHKCTEDLRTRYAHVNKKAHEQYASFHKQGDALKERQDELEASAKAIDDFIRVLDRRKDEAIERTFQQVSAGFTEVFEQLVPLGHGSLHMIRNEEQSVGGEDGLQYAGVAIRVSFNSKTDEGLLMSQLSGGQKSLVALALIFAIQKCDPAPFYLFDEIDANLDAAYRTSLSALLAQFKVQGAQFITTTFRPELLAEAESFFGVSFGGRVSRVESITREQALQFVESDPLQR